MFLFCVFFVGETENKVNFAGDHIMCPIVLRTFSILSSPHSLHASEQHLCWFIFTLCLIPS